MQVCIKKLKACGFMKIGRLILNNQPIDKHDEKHKIATAALEWLYNESSK